MPSACLPLQDGCLEYLKDRACLHAQSKTSQKIMYKFEVCFNPSIEISICTGSSGVMPKSCYAGYMNKVELPPIAPPFDSPPSSCCFSKILPRGAISEPLVQGS